MGFEGTELKAEMPIAKGLAEGLGGVILFDYDMPRKIQGKNCLDSVQIKRLNQQIRHMARNNPTTPFIALDYEGGVVDRLQNLPDMPKTCSPKRYALLDATHRRRAAQKMAQTLHTLGFNLNFAPVVDLNLNESQGIIGPLERSFSSCPETVAVLAKKFIEVFFKEGIACCCKHFPGHGSASGDTHTGLVDVTDTFHADELLPYKLLASQTMPPCMVMTAHVINRHLDAQGVPATLSYSILTELLRDSLGFKGIIISDDLQMHALSKHYCLSEALCLTINAGVDMVIIANQLGNASPEEVIDSVYAMVESNAISLQRIEEAYARIIRFKQAFQPSFTLTGSSNYETS